MAFLTERDRTAVREQFVKVAGPVKIVVFGTQLAGGHSVETERLVRELAECSDHIEVEAFNLHIDRAEAERYGIERSPAVVVLGARDYGIRFYGLPAGYEFTNLVDAVVVASSGTPALSPGTLAQLENVTSPLHIQVFSTPT